MIVPCKVSKEDKKNKMTSDIAKTIFEEAQYYYEATEILEEEREKDKLCDKLSCCMGCWVFEVNEVDGHKIFVD